MTIKMIKYSQFPSIYFDLADTRINTSEEKKLSTIAIILEKQPHIKIKIIGNACNIGSVEQNYQLGLSRANNVMKHLTTVYKISETRFEIVSAGEEAPLAKEDNKQKSYNDINRRVDFEVVE